MEQITDYSTLLRFLLHQYKDSDNLKSIIQAALSQADDIEKAAFEIKDLFTIQNAEGAQLDIIGTILLVGRNGLSDGDYRNVLLKKASINNPGTPESIIETLKALYSATFVSYTPEYPGKFRLSTDADITLEELQEIAPAGVQGFFSDLILDANNNNITDYFGNKLTHVNIEKSVLLVDGNGEQLIDGNDAKIESFEHV